MVKNCLTIYDRKCESLYDVYLRFKDVEFVINSRPVIFNESPISAHELVIGRPQTLPSSDYKCQSSI